jgi:hypothetical protein
MPSPSAIAVWVNPLAVRMRLMRGPANIFCSAIGNLDRFSQKRSLIAFTIFTHLQRRHVKDNTYFLYFLVIFISFSRSFRTAM